MRADLLVLLDERRAKAAVAWPFVTRSPKPLGPSWDRAFDGVFYDVDEWMGLAGLTRRDHRHVAPFLFVTGAVLADGTVSPEAQAFARRMTAGLLAAPPKRKRDE